MEFKHGGEDTKNWAGHYGAKMSMSAVFVGQKRKKRAKRVSLIFESRHRKTVGKSTVHDAFVKSDFSHRCPHGES